MDHMYSLAYKNRYFRKTISHGSWAMLCFRESCSFSFRSNYLEIKLPILMHTLNVPGIWEHPWGKGLSFALSLCYLKLHSTTQALVKKENLSAKFLILLCSSEKLDISPIRVPQVRSFWCQWLNFEWLKSYVRIQTQSSLSFQSGPEHS